MVTTCVPTGCLPTRISNLFVLLSRHTIITHHKLTSACSRWRINSSWRLRLGFTMIKVAGPKFGGIAASKAPVSLPLLYVKNICRTCSHTPLKRTPVDNQMPHEYATGLGGPVPWYSGCNAPW